MTKKSDLIDEDVVAVYDLAWSQAREDREEVLSVYRELRSLVSGSAEKYTLSGDTLAKFADIRIKQTAQIIELLKILHKNKQADESLTDADLERIKSEIEEK